IDRGFASGGIAQRDQGSAETKAAQRLTGHGPADALDDDIDALAGRYPANAVGETFRGEVNYVFEAKFARPRGFRRAASRRDHLAGPLRPRELIGRAPTAPPIPGANTVMPGLNPACVSVICAVR